MILAELLIGAMWYRLEARGKTFVVYRLDGCNGNAVGPEMTTVPAGGLYEVMLLLGSRPAWRLHVPFAATGEIELNGRNLSAKGKLEMRVSDRRDLEFNVRFRADGNASTFRPGLKRELDFGGGEHYGPEGDEWKGDRFRRLDAVSELSWLVDPERAVGGEEFLIDHEDPDLRGTNLLRVTDTPVAGADGRRSLGFLRQVLFDEPDDRDSFPFHGSEARLFDMVWAGNPKPGFILAQLPAADGPCGVEWRWGVVGAYDRTGAQAWNSVADTYLAHHRALLGGGGTSLLPRLPIDELERPRRGWVVLLRRHEREPHAVPELFAPMAAGVAAIELGGLGNHRGDGVRGTAEIAAPIQVETPSSVFTEEPDLAKLDATASRKLLADFGRLLGLRVRGQDRLPTLALNMVVAEAYDPGQRVRVGAFDLNLGRLRSPDESGKGLRSAIRVAADVRRTAFDAEIALRLPVARVQAGGQDDLAFDVFSPENTSDDEAAFLERDPVVVVPLAGAAGSQLTLEGQETVRPGFSQAVSVNLLRTTGGSVASQRPRVVVIQRQPFLIAAVEFGQILTQPLPGAGSTVAKWSNREGSRWEIATREGFNLVLPPQAVGEEMEKAKNLAPRRSTPLDFRLGPNAVVGLARSEHAAVFTEPPWNLRRLLDRPDPVRAGVAVQHLEYELLYGMTCEADRPPLTRIAEITSRLGRVPGMPPATPVWEHVTAEHQKAYLKWRGDWLSTLRAYLSRLSVLELWREHGTGSFVLSDGLSCRLRVGPNGADLASPFPNDETPAGPVGAGAVPLQGGVTWGFEVGKIYRLVRDAPQSTSARTTDLMFSALGGWGDVQGSYDRGLSTLGAQVSMGRVERYTVERIGRLGCYWNRLKHVIVYERTVLPSEQFKDDQEPFPNRAVVRKVEEYVEFVEDRRRYPDHPEAAARATGPLLACSVQEGYRVRVKSAWGSNTRNGWKLPLWNREAAQAQPHLYPKPNVFVTLAGADKGETTPEIENPDRLVFFTTTLPNTDPDPSRWPPEEGVDYVALPPPEIAETPRGAATPAEAVRTVPPDSRVEPGYEAVTFLLREAPPADLMAERGGEPIGAVLRSIAPVRAIAREVTDEQRKTVRKIRDAAGAGRTALERLQGQLAPLLRLTDEAAFQTELVRVAPQAIAAAAAAYPVATFNAAVADAKASADQVHLRLQEKLSTATSEAAKRYVYGIGQLRRVEGIAEEVGEGYLSQLALFRDTIGGQLRARFPNRTADPEQLKQAVETLVGELRTRLATIPVDTAPLESHAKLAKRAADDWIAHADAFAAGLPAEFRERELRALLETIREWQADFEGIRLQLAAAPIWIPTPTAAWDAVSAPYRDRLERVRLRAEAALATGGTLARNVITTAVMEAKAEAVKVVVPTLLLAESRVEARLAELKGAMQAQVSSLDAVIRAGEDKSRELIATAGTLVTDLGAQLSTRAAAYRDFAKAYEQEVWRALRPLALEGNGLLQALQQVPRAAELESWIREQRAAWEGQLAAGAGMALGEVRRMLGDAEAIHSQVLRLERAFGDPPQVPGLEFNRPGLAYVFKAADAAGVDMTPVLAGVNRVVAVGQAAAGLEDALNAVGLHLPTRELAGRLVPDLLHRFDLNRVFRDLAGLKLDHLFPSLRLPQIANDRVRVRHSFDVGSRRAQVQAEVSDLRIGNPTLLALGPLRIILEGCVFSAETRIEVGADGSTQQDSRGSVLANWVLQIGGERMLTLREAGLRFSQGSGLRFEVDPKNVELAPAMKLVTDLLASWDGKPNGLSVAVTPHGIESRFAMALPDLQAGTSSITNLSFGVVLGIRTGGEFGIDAGFQIGHRDAPFALTIFVLGGGGYIDVRASFVPGAGTLRCEVDVAMTASAGLGVNLGPVRGSVFVYVGTTVHYASGGENRGLAVGLLFILSGEVTVLSIVSISLTLSLRAVWDGKRLNGTGQLSLKIKICWCFTLKVKREIHFALGCVDAALHPHGAAAGLLTRGQIDELARLYLASLE